MLPLREVLLLLLLLLLWLHHCCWFARRKCLYAVERRSVTPTRGPTPVIQAPWGNEELGERGWSLLGRAWHGFASAHLDKVHHGADGRVDQEALVR